MIEPTEIPQTTPISWPQCYRVSIPAHAGIDYIGLSQTEQELIQYTDPVSRMQEGSLPPNYGVGGERTLDLPQPLASAFTTLDDSLFGDGGFGILYLTPSFDGAIQEFCDRISPLYAVTDCEHAFVDLVVSEFSLAGEFYDYLSDDNQELIGPDTDRQELGRMLRADVDHNCDGLVFLSHVGGHEVPAAGVFRACSVGQLASQTMIRALYQDGRFTGYNIVSPFRVFSSEYSF